MLFRMVRGMPSRQVATLAAVFGCFLLFYLHLIGEITRLDTARLKLERAVAKLQLDNLDFARRPLSSSRFQDTDLDAGDDMIIIYNRVPKTGSTSFAGIAYELCSKNGYHVLHLNVTKNSHILSLSDQFRFVNNISTWESKKPAMYHGHLAYLEFSRFGVQKKPIFINLIRDPLDRLVSYYYFLRHGDDFRPHLKRRKAGNRETFDECVMKQGPDCDPNNLWMQIPFFCGHSAQCWEPGNRWALEQAKYNLVQNYLVVGITEELGDFVAILEATLPRFFRGAVDLYNKGEISRLRKTFNKISPSEETVSAIHESEVWKMENEFYEFAVEQFHFIKKRTFGIRDGEFVEKGKQFNYEKIRPR
ncbi:heparan sulfate 2-O-sulfotransferase 1-like [Liolophura sinensis]|uniref:heparan sulfate 2-O-sulfotransferase 1-like n=1 Tax=Liolophura sinensis TaxID=3198878 RepID=UPI0031584002